MEDRIQELLLQYGVVRPETALIRHNENRTYKVIDKANAGCYLLRVHDPVTVNLAGIQHTRQGVECELQLLEAIAHGTELPVQVPVANLNGQRVTSFEYEGRTLYGSLLRWIEGRNLTKEDLSIPEAAYDVGAQVANLHAFLDTYDKVLPKDRPEYGIRRTEKMLGQIRRGVDYGLFSNENFLTVEQTIALLVDRLQTGQPERVKMGVIHADLNMSNVLVTPTGNKVFIDFGLFGFGYRLLDVAMMALNAPRETREQVVRGYYGKEPLHGDLYGIIEGFMLSAVLGYYAFTMENESVHPWIRERMPQFCETRCAPFLRGESIFLSF